jgi:dTMP kinase
MKIPFAKKIPADRRAETAKRLAETEEQAKTAEAERLRLALAGESTDAAEEASWKLAARAKTLTDALAALDQEIAAEAAAAAERARRQQHDKAATIAREQHAEVVALRAKLVGAINETARLTVMHDIACLEHSSHQVSASVQHANAALFALDVARQSWSRGIEKLESGNAYADTLARRILEYKAPVLKQVE